ncbi:hypothetical protein ABT174_18040 [Streptomyces sparsogenes]
MTEASIAGDVAIGAGGLQVPSDEVVLDALLLEKGVEGADQQLAVW